MATDKDKEPTGKPADTAPGTPAEGGAQLFLGSPVVQGIPVVVPVVEGVPVDKKLLVHGVAVAAPVVSGIPEMISNQQIEHQGVNQTWKKGDIRSIHQALGEVQIDYVEDDGQVRSERHIADDRTFRKLQKEFEEGQDKAKAFISKNFSKATQIKDPDDLGDDE